MPQKRMECFILPFDHLTWIEHQFLRGIRDSRKAGSLCIMFWPSTRPQKMLFQGDAPERNDTFQWPVIERDRVGGLRLIIWDKVKIPLCQYRLMHRKRVTSELHDSYFRLMTIKHSISKIQWAIVWALNYYLTQLSSSPRSSCQ